MAEKSKFSTDRKRGASYDDAADQALQDMLVAAADETSHVNMQIAEYNRFDPMLDTSSVIVEDTRTAEAYVQNWMGDEQRDLQELGQLVGVLQAPTRGFLTKQGWHSINNPNFPYTRDSSVEVYLSPEEYIDRAANGEDSDDEYFDPEHYLVQQDDYEPELAGYRPMNRVAEFKGPENGSTESGNKSCSNEKAREKGSQSATKKKRIWIDLTLDNSSSELSDVPDDLEDPDKKDALLIKSKNAIDPTESRRVALSVSDSVAVAIPSRKGTIECELGCVAASGRASGRIDDNVRKARPARNRPLGRRSAPASIKVLESSSNDSPEIEHDGPKDQSKEGEWKLVNGDVSSPIQGQPAPDKLKIDILSVENKDDQIFESKKIKEEDIDWNDGDHITITPQWRRQVFRRHAFEKKRVNIRYTPEEDAWLELCHEKMKAAVNDGEAIEMPSIPMIGDAFNAFFSGRIDQDAKGQKLPRREARETSSFQGKFMRKNTKVHTLREQVRALVDAVDATDRVVYIPTITENELRQYRKNGTVDLDDPNDPLKNVALRLPAEKLERHLHQLSSQRRRKFEALSEGNDRADHSVPEERTKAKRRKTVSTKSS